MLVTSRTWKATARTATLNRPPRPSRRRVTASPSGSLVDPAHRPIDSGAFHASFLLETRRPRLALSILNLKPWSQWSLVLWVRLRFRNLFRGSRRVLLVEGQRDDVEVSGRILASTH